MSLCQKNAGQYERVTRHPECGSSVTFLPVLVAHSVTWLLRPLTESPAEQGWCLYPAQQQGVSWTAATEISWGEVRDAAREKGNVGSSCEQFREQAGG